MRRRLALVVATATIAIAGAATPALVPLGAPALASVAKSCDAGYVHAVLPWGHKCLRRGQFCKLSGDRDYHRYGFHCHSGRLR